MPGLVDTGQVTGRHTARLELWRSCDQLEDPDVPPHPGRKIDQEGELALGMLLAGQLNEGGGLSTTGRRLEHDSMASREQVVQSSPLLYLLSLCTLLVQTEQPQIDDGIVVQPSRPVRDDLTIGGKSVLNEASTVGSGGGTAIPRCSAHRTTLSGICRVADDLFSRHHDQSQPYSFFISLSTSPRRYLVTLPDVTKTNICRSEKCGFARLASA